MAKAPGLYAPDGSKYVTLVAVATKARGSQSPDGALYVTVVS